MKKTRRIRLENVRCYAYHGYYPSERTTGTEFRVDVEVRWDTAGRVDDDISRTVNYEDLYITIEKEMMVAHHLLETVAENIADRISEAHPFLQYVEVTIHKPVQLGGPADRASVTETRYI